MDCLCRSAKCTCLKCATAECSCFSCCEMVSKNCGLCALRIPAVYVPENKMHSSKNKKPRNCHCFLSADEGVNTSRNTRASSDCGTGNFLTTTPIIPGFNPQSSIASPLKKIENICSRLNMPVMPEVIATSEPSNVTGKKLSCAPNRKPNALSTNKGTGARNKLVLQKQLKLSDTIDSMGVHQEEASEKKAKSMESNKTLNSDTPFIASVQQRRRNNEIDGVEISSSSTYPYQQNSENSDFFARIYHQRVGNPDPKYRPTNNYGFVIPNHIQHHNSVCMPSTFGPRIVPDATRYRFSHYGPYKPFRPRLSVPVDVMSSRQKVEKWLKEQDSISNETQPSSSTSTLLLKIPLAGKNTNTKDSFTSNGKDNKE